MNIGICGILGRMGGIVLKKSYERGHEVSVGLDNVRGEEKEQDENKILHMYNLNLKVGDISAENLDQADGIIDFSLPAATMELIDAIEVNPKPLVIGTTGLDESHVERIVKASGKAPILYSPNMSMAVNLLFKLTELASKALGNRFDIEVFESHHRFKKDAPSGTAKKLLSTIKDNIPELKDCREIAGREGISDTERSKNEVGVFAMRGGDIVGEHTVYYIGTGERIELTHRATSREIFAEGAVTALEYVIEKEPGLYSMYDVLGL
jgi:4-hydroxy-tetrahydrodipicolinate reductase